MLHTVEPYVLYGTPSNETVADLVRRRGYCKIEGKRVQLSDNNLIEEHLGDVGLICVEDVIAVLTAGEEVDVELFGRVTKFLWPFRMSARKSKFQRRLLDYKEGKLYGDQGEVMNGYIREML
jgi:large subunit ribosomal protein L7e